MPRLSRAGRRSRSGSRFAEKATTRPVGAARLTDAQATSCVTPAANGFERRTLNTENARVPTGGELTTYLAANNQPYGTAVTGDSGGTLAARLGRTPTTDEWVQWAAWKWGVDEDTLRAVCVQETLWFQRSRGDWVSDANGDRYTSFGVTQVKGQVGQVAANGWAGTFPLSKLSTAFNLDYWGRAFRSAFDGLETWLNDGVNSPLNGAVYTAGDEYGCVGLWFFGHWRTTQGNAYADLVYGYKAAKTWEAYDGGDGTVATLVNNLDFEDTTKSATDLGLTSSAGQTTVPMPGNVNTYPIFGSRSWTIVATGSRWFRKDFSGYHYTTYHDRNYFRVSTANTTANAQQNILAFRTTGGAEIAAVWLPVNSLAPIVRANGATVATLTALTAGQSYRFEARMYTGGDGFGELEVLVDGVQAYTSGALDDTHRGVALQSTPTGNVLWGNTAGGGATGNNSWDKVTVTQNAAGFPGA